MSNKPLEKITLYVNGMHCSACEALIESRIKGSKATLSEKKVVISANDKSLFPNISALNEQFKDLGYSFSYHKPSSTAGPQVIKGVILALALILIFLINERLGLFNTFSVSNTSSVPAFFVFGLIAGFSSCAALTGGILLSLSKNWVESYSSSKSKPFILFNLGRIFSFFVLGGLLGLIGNFFSLSLETTSIFTIIVSTIMIVLALQLIGISWANKIKIPSFSFISNGSPQIAETLPLNKKSAFFPFLVGALTFFLPCGFTIIAQTAVLTTNSFISGATMLTAFAVGTLPALALISFSSIKLYSNQRYSQAFSYTAGTLLLFFAVYTINSQLNVLGIPSLNNLINTQRAETTVTEDNKNFQILAMEASSFEYTPKFVKLKTGVPVKWEFYNNGATGCATSVISRGLFSGTLNLKPGLNTFEFTPNKTGTYKITCSMGMVPPVTVEVY